MQRGRSLPQKTIARAGALCEDPFNNVAVDIRKTEIAPAVVVSQSLVIDTEYVKDGCVKIMNMHRLVLSFEAEVVGGAVGQSVLHRAPCEPYSEAERVMIAPAATAARLDNGCAAKFGPADDQCVFP